MLMQKLMVKCLNISQPDTVLFQPKHIKQPLLKAVNRDPLVVEEPTKTKYFDQGRMVEVYMERLE